MTKPKPKEEWGKNGRPTLWTPGLNERLVEWFSYDEEEDVDFERTKSTSAQGESTELVAKPYPKFSRFEMAEGLAVGLLSEWALEEDCELKRPSFRESYNTAKRLQKEFLTDGALKGLYPPASFIFIAKNVTDMRDVSEVEQKGSISVKWEE